jgi:hypothetical protein
MIDEKKIIKVLPKYLRYSYYSFDTTLLFIILATLLISIINKSYGI